MPCKEQQLCIETKSGRIQRLLREYRKDAGIIGRPLRDSGRNGVQDFYADLEITGDITAMNRLMVGDAVT